MLGAAISDLIKAATISGNAKPRPMYYLIKVLISALLITLISELAKRNTTLAALMASLPFTSILAFIWLYADSGDTQAVASLARQIFWLVIPSLAFFVMLWWTLQIGLNFWLSLGVSMAITAVSYGLMLHFFHLSS